MVSKSYYRLLTLETVYIHHILSIIIIMEILSLKEEKSIYGPGYFSVRKLALFIPPISFPQK